MRKVITVLLLILMLPVVFIAQAQSELFEWPDAGVSVELPVGWASMAYNGGYLFGTPGDMAHVESGEQPESPVILLRLIPKHPAEETPARTLSALATDRRPESGTLTVGSESMDMVYPETALAGWTYDIAFVEDRFVVTGMWRESQADDGEATLTDFISRIEVTSSIYTVPLTKWVSMGNLRFRAPEMWLMANDSTPNFYMVTTQAERISTSATFQVTRLMIDMRDVSAFRPMLSGESLLGLSGLWISDEVIASGAVTLREIDINGIDAYKVSFSDEDLQGEAYLLMTPMQAYFFAGAASPEAWRDGDRELFEAILATVEIDEG